MKGIIVGLGNPGPKYDGTRHNCGFDFVDLLLEQAQQNGTLKQISSSKFNSLLWRIALPALPGEWLCAKPQTFMNLSGLSVQPLAAYYRLTPDDLIVVHDELDIPAGQLRFKYGGGNAGHNGLKSICEQLGTEKFYRLRIGIGRPENRDAVLPWVLGRLSGQERQLIADGMRAGLDVLKEFVRNGKDKASGLARTFGKSI